MNTELLKRVNNMANLAGIREFTLTCGKGAGMRAFEVHNAAGLRFTVLADKCMDILEVSYKGTNISFNSKNGLVSETRSPLLGEEFLYYFNGGMLTTCGPNNAGGGCDDNGTWRAFHGRFGCQSAENVTAKAFWDGDDYIMELTGDIRDSRLFGYNFLLSRTIRTSLYSKSISISDTLVNCQPEAEEYMMLYHINFGYPLLDAGARVVSSDTEVIPRTPFAAEDMRWNEIDSPEDGLEERCYFHKCTADERGFARVGLLNDELKLGAFVKYNLDSLPLLVEWKSMCSHDYALGLEPSNSYIKGRVEERENGTLRTLGGYEKAEFKLTIGILEGEELRGFETELGALK